MNGVAWQNGHRDGYEKGVEDARDRDSYDPVRHSRYRNADRGYDRRYGSKDQYSWSTVTASKPATPRATASTAAIGAGARGGSRGRSRPATEIALPEVGRQQAEGKRQNDRDGGESPRPGPLSRARIGPAPRL